MLNSKVVLLLNTTLLLVSRRGSSYNITVKTHFCESANINKFYHVVNKVDLQMNTSKKLNLLFLLLFFLFFLYAVPNGKKRMGIVDPKTDQQESNKSSSEQRSKLLRVNSRCMNVCLSWFIDSCFINGLSYVLLQTGWWSLQWLLPPLLFC